MKAAGIILIVLVLAAVAGLGWLYLNTNVVVSSASCIATEAVLQAETFNRVKEEVQNGSFVGTRFSGEALQEADAYQFLTYTVALDNHAFLDAETVEIRLTPMQGDVLLLSDLQEHRAPAGRVTELACALLTARGAHSVREATVTWYCWGIPFSTRLTIGR